MKKTGNKNYLLDTNVVIDLLKGQQNIADEINRSNQVYLSVFALGVLWMMRQPGFGVAAPAIIKEVRIGSN